jgi:hypothetical protein
MGIIGANKRCRTVQWNYQRPTLLNMKRTTLAPWYSYVVRVSGRAETLGRCLWRKSYPRCFLRHAWRSKTKAILLPITLPIVAKLERLTTWIPKRPNDVTRIPQSRRQWMIQMNGHAKCSDFPQEFWPACENGESSMPNMQIRFRENVPVLESSSGRLHRQYVVER